RVPLSRYGSMLTEYSDPFNAPELIVAREAMASWRFYDTFRVDVRAPARLASIGSFTPVLSGDGRDLAAALQTIREIGDHRGLDEVIDCAFPGSQVRVERRDAKMQLTLTQPGMLRNLSAAELSDGTLRFLLLTAALLTPRPPELLVLNEPENSLHPDLMPALAGLIRMAAAYSQIIVVSHNQALIDDLESSDECVSIRLNKENGATVIKDGDLLSRFGWKWPAR
ncbi:MAG: AAA family ATPase, partial [Planctomycetota bacterium]